MAALFHSFSKRCYRAIRLPHRCSGKYCASCLAAARCKASRKGCRWPWKVFAGPADDYAVGSMWSVRSCAGSKSPRQALKRFHCCKLSNISRSSSSTALVRSRTIKCVSSSHSWAEGTPRLTRDRSARVKIGRRIHPNCHRVANSTGRGANAATPNASPAGAGLRR